MYITLHMPPKEKNLGVLGRAILLATQQVPSPFPFLPVDSVQMCSYLQAEVRWSAIMLEPHFSVYRKGFSCMSSGSVFWRNSRQANPFKRSGMMTRCQQIISKNSTPDVYVESRLVNSDKHCVPILVVPDEAVSAVEVAISCEAGLISKQDLCRKGRIHDAPLEKPLENRTRGATSLGPSPCTLWRFCSCKTRGTEDPWHGQWHVC